MENNIENKEELVHKLTPLEKLTLNYALPPSYSFQNQSDVKKLMEKLPQEKRKKSSRRKKRTQDIKPVQKQNSIQEDITMMKKQTCVITIVNRSSIYTTLMILKKELFRYFEIESIRKIQLKDIIDQFKNVEQSILDQKPYFTHELQSSIEFIFSNLYPLVKNSPQRIQILKNLQKRLNQVASFKSNIESQLSIMKNNKICDISSLRSPRQPVSNSFRSTNIHQSVIWEQNQQIIQDSPPIEIIMSTIKSTSKNAVIPQTKSKKNLKFTKDEICDMERKLMVCRKPIIEQIFNVVSNEEQFGFNLHTLSDLKLRKIKALLQKN